MADKEHLMPTENQPSDNEQPTSAQNPTTPASGPTPYPPQQYPLPPTGPGPYGQQYGYNQPQPGYPPQPGYAAPPYYGAPPPQQSQQQQVVVVSSNQPQPIIVQHVPYYVGHIILSCIVFWICNPLFGLIAFILAVVANSTALEDPASARKLGQASIGLSVAGMVISVIAVVICVAVLLSATSSAINDLTVCSGYEYDGLCYNYRKYVSDYSDSCLGVQDDTYCYYD